MAWKWGSGNKANRGDEWTGFLDEGVSLEGTLQLKGTFRLDGVIFAKGRVEIQPKGVVTGEIHSPCLVIDPGGIFDGRCHMLASSESSAAVTIPIRAAVQV